MPDAIKVKGAKELLLRSVDCSIPHGQLTLISGPSGSGKSTLAVRTIAAEGRYRLALSLPPSASDIPPRPKVDAIRNLPIVEELRRPFSTNQRKTIGGVLGLDQLLHRSEYELQRFCPHCHVPLAIASPVALGSRLLAELPTSTLITIIALFPSPSAAVAWGDERGFSSAWNEGSLMPLSDLARSSCHGPAGVIVDRLTCSEENRTLLVDSLSLALEGSEAGLGLLLGNSYDQWFRYGSCKSCGFHGSKEGLLQALNALNDPESVQSEAAAVRWHGATIHEWLHLEAQELAQRAGTPAEVHQTLQNMVWTRLGHLELGRSVHALSIGEQMRMRLLQSLERNLVHPLLVLDEPLRGLHPEDQPAVLALIANHARTTVLIDHNAAAHASARWEIALGPGGGQRGGQVVYEGPPRALEFVVPPPRGALRESRGFINFCDLPGSTSALLSGRIPVAQLTAVQGISGSGKSTFLFTSLAPALQKVLNGEKISSGSVEIPPTLKRVVIVPHRERTLPRYSTVATMCGAYELLRAWYCTLPLAKIRGYQTKDLGIGKKSAKLTCPTCFGIGSDEQNDTFCTSCRGKRFVEQFLEVRWRNRTLSDILNLTIDELLLSEGTTATLREILSLLQNAGLGYLTLGQPSLTLSSGEWQRVRISSELRKSPTPTLFCFDEPTMGLTPQESLLLTQQFRALTDEGHTIVAIEHNPILLSAADWLIEFGPGAGKFGGRIVSSGPPARDSSGDAA